MPSRMTSQAVSVTGQRGAALLLLLMLVSVGALTVFVTGLNRATQQLERDRITNEALAQAKAALIGYAVSDANRPGELLCPDVDNDGQVTLSDYTGSNCKKLVGRLPWKSLGLPELRDGSGEKLWYAVSDAFHANGTASINSDTPGALSVTGSMSATQIIAVVFAPGQGLPGQVRDASNINNVEHYLEDTNATSSTDFVAGNATATFNDRLMPIFHTDLFQKVEKRVAQEARRALLTYYASSDPDPAKRYFPYAALLGSAATGCQDDLRKGHLPTTGGGCICSGTACSCTGVGTFDTFVFTTAVVSAVTFTSRSGSCTLSAANKQCSCSGVGGCTSASSTIANSGDLAITTTNPGIRKLTFNAGTAGTASFTLQGSEVFSATGGNCMGSGTGTCSCSGNGYCETTSTGNWNGSYSSSGGSLAYTYGTCSTAPLTMPAWFTDNGWENYIYYTLAEACTFSNKGCDNTPPATLTVGAVTNVNALLVSVGRRLNGTKCAASPGVPYTQAALPTINICDYLDSSINTDGNDIYDAVGTPGTSSYNDQMFIVSP